MSVEVVHHDERWIDASNTFVELDEVPGRIKDYEEFDAPENSPNDTLYRVDFEYQQQEEHYIVRTEDGMGKESRTYTIKQNDDGDWEVAQVRKSPNRGHEKISKRGQLSTPTVREAMKAKHDIELIN